MAPTTSPPHLRPVQALQLSVQFSQALCAPDLQLLKPVLSRRNVLRWTTWALNPHLSSLKALTLRVVEEDEGRHINHQFRGRDYATNILTFNDEPRGCTQADLLLCADVVIREAQTLNISLREHCAHLLIHASLHAQDYDHEHSEQEALEMETLESFLMLTLGFSDPYAITE